MKWLPVEFRFDIDRVILSFIQQVRGLARPGQTPLNRGILFGITCTCKDMKGGKEEHTPTHSVKIGAIKRKWNQGGRLGTTIQGPAPPEFRRRTRLLYFAWLYFYSVMCLKNCRFSACFHDTMNIHFHIPTLTLRVKLSWGWLYFITFVSFMTHFHTYMYRSLKRAQTHLYE